MQKRLTGSRVHGPAAPDELERLNAMQPLASAMHVVDAEHRPLVEKEANFVLLVRQHAHLLALELHPAHTRGRPDDNVIVLVCRRQKRMQVWARLLQYALHRRQMVAAASYEMHCGARARKSNRTRLQQCVVHVEHQKALAVARRVQLFHFAAGNAKLQLEMPCMSNAHHIYDAALTFF